MNKKDLDAVLSEFRDRNIRHYRRKAADAIRAGELGATYGNETSPHYEVAKAMHQEVMALVDAINDLIE